MLQSEGASQVTAPSDRERVEAFLTNFQVPDVPDARILIAMVRVALICGCAKPMVACLPKEEKP